MVDLKFIIKLFELLEDAELGLGDILLWHADSDKNELSFSILCNDIFYWACGDAEEITADNLDILKNSIQDVGAFVYNKDGDFNNVAALLFCSRVRKLRPQGAVYSFIPKELWDLFNDCGPVRDVDSGNPYEIGSYVGGILNV